MIDRHHAAFDLQSQPMCCFSRGGKCVGGKAIGQPVGFPDRFIEMTKPVNNGNRSERLLVHGQGLCRHVGQHGWLEEIPLVTHALTARRQPRSAPGRIRDHFLHHRHPPFIGNRSHSGLRIKAIANVHFLHRFNKTVKEPVRDLFLHQKAGRRDADLTGIANF